ncbi:MAG: hypothetical protein CL878_06880 [Dehalococcoidia bacterium]|nr:hypothetical protein [Dehalococcoidia bacterium]
MTEATSRAIRITAGDIEALADLDTSETADAVWEALPFTIPANTWGEEIYFAIPVGMDEDDAQPTVELGDLGYWPPGRAFCIFFGPTPMSSPGEIRPASAVNVFGKLRGDPTVFRSVRTGTPVAVERAT